MTHTCLQRHICRTAHSQHLCSSTVSMILLAAQQFCLKLVALRGHTTSNMIHITYSHVMLARSIHAQVCILPPCAVSYRCSHRVRQGRAPCRASHPCVQFTMAHATCKVKRAKSGSAQRLRQTSWFASHQFSASSAYIFARSTPSSSRHHVYASSQVSHTWAH